MKVSLRQLGPDDWASVLAVRAAPDQQHLIATVEKTRTEVDANPTLTAFAIYDASRPGLPDPEEPPVGFAVTEVVASVGFVLRLLIGEHNQHKGYGRAAMAALVRRLRMNPDVEMVATSHWAGNAAMERLCVALGFVPWQTSFDPPEGEVYLRLPP